MNDRLSKIRNFSIIAHIDHGKSTLSDRMLEVTQTVEKRKMQDQILDSMELERERGITIKMQPVRMNFPYNGQDYVLNLIDTPGHIDFSYEVSRALKAVEGSILLVDATQGVQAQTLTTLEMAKAANLVIIPAVSKVDSPLAKVDDVKLEIATILNCDLDDILEVSGKTGQGVPDLLAHIVAKVPAPKEEFIDSKEARALIFDFEYSNHQGVIVYVRMLDGKIMRGDQLVFAAAKQKFNVMEVGTFNPSKSPKDAIFSGEIGYIVTGIKQPGIASVGDTITDFRNPLPVLYGYQQPRPVVWASIYPESQDDFMDLKYALARLKLSDSAFSYEEETSGALGRGFRCGFLGMLHLEIISERLRREFSLTLIVTLPSITYNVTLKSGKKEIVYSPHMFPNDGEVSDVQEPWVELHIMSPNEFLGGIATLIHEHEGDITDMQNFGDGRTRVDSMMPLRELMRDFFDSLKSVTSGYASISYEIKELRTADVTRLDILLAGDVVPAFTRVVARRRATEEAELAVEKLHEIMPRQQFEMKIQGYVLGRIVASKTIKAFRKDVLTKGSKSVGAGDRTRKMKLLEKQKEGKKRMRDQARINIPHDVFLKMMKK
jgi:GTP-binding protein LepA